MGRELEQLKMFYEPHDFQRCLCFFLYNIILYLYFWLTSCVCVLRDVAGLKSEW